MQASIAAEAGSGAESAAGEEEAGSDSDSGVETDWDDMGPSLQDFDEWPDAPVMMCPDPADRQQVGCCAAAHYSLALRWSAAVQAAQSLMHS
jgi:hypothetical protein